MKSQFTLLREEGGSEISVRSDLVETVQTGAGGQISIVIFTSGRKIIVRGNRLEIESKLRGISSWRDCFK